METDNNWVLSVLTFLPLVGAAIVMAIIVTALCSLRYKIQ